MPNQSWEGCNHLTPNWSYQGHQDPHLSQGPPSTCHNTLWSDTDHWPYALRVCIVAGKLWWICTTDSFKTLFELDSRDLHNGISARGWILLLDVNSQILYAISSFETVFNWFNFELDLVKTTRLTNVFIDPTWWRHQMETFAALLALCAGNSPVPVNSPHKGQWRGALMFSLICVWINGWVNNREAGDLRLYRAHYDVTVMSVL